MNTKQLLMERSNSSCELSACNDSLTVYPVPPRTGQSEEDCVLICGGCLDQINSPQNTDVNHWRCLNDSMWSQVPAVQVLVWRQLTYLATESWAQDLLDMLYLEDEVLEWAKATLDNDSGEEDTEPTLDSNGAALQAGDTVTLIKDLVVKGANFTAKRGTAVRNISLTSNPEHIEGRVNGTRIVLLACFLKKSN